MKHRRGSGSVLASLMAAAAVGRWRRRMPRAMRDRLAGRFDRTKTIVGQGPNGEKAASVDAVKLSDAEIAKVKAGKFKVGISMQTMNLDWSQLQVQGITDTLKKYGVEVIGTASAEYQVDKQIADIENTIQRHPDGIISIPVDGTATAATYKKVSAGRHQTRVHGQRADRPQAS